MKLLSAGLGISILVAVFVVLPFLLLNQLVMPELDGLKNIYGNADRISSHIANGPTASAGTPLTQ